MTGQCSAPALPDDTPCDDNDPCTTNDTCQSGTCTGTPVVCTAPDDCHDAGTCDPTTGECSAPTPKPDGTACSDNDACTLSDTCQNGSCIPGPPKTCTASDQCHDPGTCDPATGTCSNPPKANGTTCSDNDACTQTDVCQAGVCTGTNPVVCPTPDQCHAAGTCDPATGICSNPAKANGTTCNDNDACTQTDVCQAGVCTGTNPVVCPTPDQCHDPGTCDPADGTCSNPAKPNGTTCDDGDACTQPDTCQAGTCTRGIAKVCTALDQCHDVGTCDSKTGLCSNPEKATGATCDDGNVCTASDTCQAGVCTGSSIEGCCLADAECADAASCTDDRCTDHACVHVPFDARCGLPGDCTAPACAPADPAADPDGCVVRAVNEAGYCTEDTDPCTADVCRTGTCAHEPDGSGASCAALLDPFHMALDLRARAAEVEDGLVAAVKADCASLSAACDVVAGGGKSPAPHLMDLLARVRSDLDATTVTLGGRLAAAASPDATRDPVIRARLALGLLRPTPVELRGFVASVAQARRRHLVSRRYAVTLQRQGRTLLRGTNKLRARLRRLTIRTQSFAK
ncbi:MAG TPA: hypothetical protein VFD84_05780 [Candidatus Binatia bacterium]|nr:hypothetical protein [Candidatus Binatia bacterium]